MDSDLTLFDEIHIPLMLSVIIILIIGKAKKVYINEFLNIISLNI